jgi:hypothetical protein
MIYTWLASKVTHPTLSEWLIFDGPARWKKNLKKGGLLFARAGINLKLIHSSNKKEHNEKAFVSSGCRRFCCL